MQILDTTTKSLEILLGGAITTNQLVYVASYVDVTATSLTPAASDGLSNNTTAVTIVSAPAASTQRLLKELSIYNNDTVAATVTLRLNDNSTFRIIAKVLIQAGETLAYSDVKGVYVIGKLPVVQLTNPAYTDQTLTDGATINWDMNLGGVATITLGGNRTMAAPTNMKKGVYILHVVQDGTGSRTITWNAVFKWQSAVAPVLTTTLNRRDVMSFICDGTNLYGSFMLDVR